MKTIDMAKRIAKSEFLTQYFGSKIKVSHFNRLDESEIKILYHRFVERKTLKETGIDVGNIANDGSADAERIRQRQHRALQKLLASVIRMGQACQKAND